jgi:hypothetical protein
MKTSEALVNWLLEEDAPGVRLRALTGLRGLSPNHEAARAARRRVMQTLPAARDDAWQAGKGQALVYNLTALAESGLTCEDLSVKTAADTLLAEPWDANCGNFMALRALVMVGYADDPRVRLRLEQAREDQLPDGGWLCLHRVRKMQKTPKSCIRAAMHALLLAGELRLRGLSTAWSEALAGYFLRRRLFYRTDHPDQLVLADHPGKRMTDVYFPCEYFRVGLPLLLEALAALGAGEAPELAEAWGLLEAKRDAQGRLPLEGTLPLNKAYLGRERVGRPSKWGTLYAALAWKHRSEHQTGEPAHAGI